MNQRFWIFGLILVLATKCWNVAAATTYYVATDGNNLGDGSIGAPFGTFDFAIDQTNPGDTVFVRGGTYNLSTRVRIQADESGEDGNRINLWAYPGETPILDFSGMDVSLNGLSNGRGIQFDENASWWHVKGLTVQYARDNGVYSGGGHNILEQLVTRWNGDSGLQLHDTAAFNLVLNSDSYENYDSYTVAGGGAPAPGENADGFAVKDPDIGIGNVFRGNRAWANSDDGWDTFDAVGSGVLIQECWAFDNGFNIWGVPNFAGDGTGYKLGQDGGDHVMTNDLAINNAGHGVDVNANGTGVEVYHTTSIGNNKANWFFDETAEQTINQHLLKNNISFAGVWSDEFLSGVDHSSNSWNGPVVTEQDFKSLARIVNLVDLLKAPRKADGSLPDLGSYLQLAYGSDLTNSGMPITFEFGGEQYSVAYKGAAPDLGAFESPEPTSLMLVGFVLLGLPKCRRAGRRC
jgi:Right handed beta helix region